MTRRSSTRLVVAILAALLCGASAPVVAQTPSFLDVCDPGAPTLRLHVLNEAHASRESLDVAMREAAEIWAGAGLRLTWFEGMSTADATTERPVIVMVRRVLVSAPANAESRAHARPPLGWVPFGDDGPANLIEVSLSAITSLVMGGWHGGRRIADLPTVWQEPLVGRALGRVVAHEIGHWLVGRGHTAEGLMKAAVGRRDLLERAAPVLPTAWTDAGAAELLGASARCQAATRTSP